MADQSWFFWMTQVDARIWQAFVAAAVVAIGWTVTARQNRAEKRRLRDERMNDVQKAIYAEIDAYLEVLQDPDPLLYSAEIIRQMEEATTAKPYVPFIPTENNDSIFRALMGDITALPRVSIDAVVKYYSQIKAIEALISDLRDPSFSNLEPARRVLIYEDYIALKVEAIHLGKAALAVIKLVNKHGPLEAEKIMEREKTDLESSKKARKQRNQDNPSTEPNTPDADPYDP